MKIASYIIACFLCFPLFNGQQNSEFREVKNRYDQHRTMIETAFIKEFQQQKSLNLKLKMEEDYRNFMMKFDSVQNAAMLMALIRVKNKEGIRTVNRLADDLSENFPKTIDKMAEYPGGINRLRGQLVENLYFDSATNQDILKTNIRFVVNSDGEILDVNAEGDDPNFNRQAEIAMYLIPEKFLPAESDGVAMASYFRIPLSLNLE